MADTIVPCGQRHIRATGLREHLDSRGIKHAWLARQLGWSRKKMHNIVSGVTRVQPNAAVEICALLDAQFFLLFEFTDERSEGSAETAA